MGPSTQHDRSERKITLNDALTQFIDARSKTDNSGNYVAAVQTIVEDWIQWCANQNIRYVHEVDAQLLQSWIGTLREKVREDNLSPQSAHQYFAVLRAYLSYCTEWEWLATNPAKQERVKNELPALDPTGSDPTQTWSDTERIQLLRHVDRRAHDAIDDKGSAAVTECRDRAVVYLLALTGARTAELVRSPDDARRTGITWGDVNYNEQTITVLGKDQQQEPVQFPSRAHAALQRYEDVLAPPTPEWPVFPTNHAPTLHKQAETLVSAIEERDPREILRNHESPPPAITTTTVRNILKRLSKHEEVTVEGEYDYLKPHGARRGLGKKLYTEASFEAAQKALRHNDPSTTSEMYADVSAEETAAITDDVFSDR